MIVKFPHINSFKNKVYYNVHLSYLKNLFEYNNINVEYYQGYQQDKDVVFKIYINNKPVYVDFSDHQLINTLDRPLIKCHLKYDYTGDIIPYAPISFYNWDEYFSLEKQIKYNFNKVILNNQRPYGNALERRNNLIDLLKITFPNEIDLSLTDQLTYWKKINTAKIAIFAPGARNHILDRGQLQYMAFGCCTISPEINDLLPYNKILIPDVHYIKCNQNFSNLKDIIDNLDKDKCIEIGNNAKQLFLETCTPKAIITNILETLKIK